MDAFKNSPLFELALTSSDDELSELASSFMGLGPWVFNRDLTLPTHCGLMQITNLNKKSSVLVTHLLKCIIRVERGDDLHLDPKTGKRKVFEIIVQSPIQILSVGPSISLF